MGIVLCCSSFYSVIPFAAADGGQGAVTYVGKINLSDLPKQKNQPHRFTMPFLPKSQSAYIQAKGKPISIHLNNTWAKPSARTLSPLTSGVKAVQVISQIYGLDQSQCSCSPPDVQIAAGPDHIVEMVNTSEEVWQKQGQPITTVSLYSFYAVPQSDFLSDPRVFFDSSSGRWFASILDVSTNSVKVAVSDSSDPTKNWNVYNVSFGSNCPDQPAIASSDDKLVVSANDFANCLTSPTLVGAQYFVLNKTQMVDGSQNPTMKPFGPDITQFSIMPAKSLGPTGTLYMVTVEGNSTSLRLYSIDGTSDNPSVHITDLPIKAVNIPPGAVQKGTGTPLETNDDRVLDAAWQNGKIWLSLTDSCTPLGDSEARSCVRLIEVDTGSAKVVQDFDVATSGTYYFYPALTIDGRGDLDVIFGYSSSSTYPGLMFGTQEPTGPQESLESMQVLKTGSAPDTSGRYGDYFGAARDPSNTTNVFVAGEIHSVTSSSPSPWSTFIGDTSYVSVPEFTTAGPVLAISIISLVVVGRITSTGIFSRNQ